MSAFKKAIHGLAIGATRLGMKFMPDRVPETLVGADSSRKLCESVAQSDAKKVLIVTDSVLVELGLVERITSSLNAAGVECSIFDGVEPDPTFDQVDAGFAQLEREGCDAIVAVGGGSPMDASKVLAAMATNGRDARKLEGKLKVRKPPMPLYAIPTTAGTGSEVTLAAVISDPDTHSKKFFVDPKLLPLMAALDPTLMAGLPPAITAATGMDALTHAVESYISVTSNPKTRDYARTSVRLVFANLPTAYTNGRDLAAREAMALASYNGGLAFTRTGVGYVHAIAHTFGAYYGTPHGMANAIALPHVLEFSRGPAEAALAELADLIGLDGANGAEKAGRFIDAVRDLMSTVDIPNTLDSLKAEDVEAIAKQALAEAHMNYPVPRYMQQDECVELVRQILPPTRSRTPDHA